MKTIAVLDFSWVMHKNQFALRDLSVTKTGPLGIQTIPTGHVYGTIQDVKNLSKHYSAVILAVDSPRTVRKEILSQYKADRHEEGSYNIYNDLRNILALCTSLPNVWYVKEKEMEADDLIASFMKSSRTVTDRHYTMYYNDNDVLQTPGCYDWCPKINGGPQSRRDYIKDKYGLEDFDYLPIWMKVIRGDSSDKIPGGIPRFPKDFLLKLCQDLNEVQDFDVFLAYLRDMRGSMSKTWQDRLVCLDDNNSETVLALRRNHSVVCPVYMSVDDMAFKKCDAGNVNSILDWYEIREW